MKKVRRALISVSDKNGLVPFARALAKRGVEILSTGGTLKALREAHIPVKAVEDFTGFPEILEGRVKTLHPRIHGGLLYRRGHKHHEAEAKKHGIQPIDLVVVNLYPFEQVTQKPGVDLETAIENIDIGGPSMLRSAAKNSESVAVICDPADYSAVLEEITKKGAVSNETRRKLATKVFQRTASYDRAISDFLSNSNGTAAKSGKKAEHAAPAAPALPAKMTSDYEKIQDLRYGENPHQRGGWYLARGQKRPFEQLHGKELSYNNLLDIEAAVDILREFEEPAACVIKHNNPCGVAEGKNLSDALERAIECDLMSAFGGIIGLNRPCDAKAAQTAMDSLKFFEVLVAPRFESAALEILQKRQNLRLIAFGDGAALPPYDFKFLAGGLLVQDRDKPLRLEAKRFDKGLKTVTKTKLSKEELQNLIFAFRCVKVVKSNAIVITQGRQTVGIGAGQMSRVDSVEIACRKAGYRTDSAYMASDAFFPMPDSIEVAAQYKIRAIIQPGGSIRDQEVIDACDRFGIAMVFTGERHFRH